MLDKYQHFKKLSKTQGCSFYDAQDRTEVQSVLLKRIPQKCTWDELLTNKNLQFLSKSQFAPRMLQIFKKKGYYFIVYEKPTGQPLSEPELIGKMPIHKFYPLFLDLCLSCVQMKKQCPQAYILPQWIFLNRSLCKIGHYEPFFGGDADEGDKHVFMYNLQRAAQLSNKAMAESDVMVFERKQSLVYNLGVIAYHLLTGKKSFNNPESEEEYINQTNELQNECFKRVQKIVKDQKFSEMISKMIKQDPFDCPNLTEIINFSRRKSKEYEPNPNSNPTLEFDMQKIQLTDKYNRETAHRKFLRPCCKTVQNEEVVDVDLEKKGNLTMAFVKRDLSKHNHHYSHTHSNSKTQRHTRHRSFLPQISPVGKHRYGSRQSSTKPTMLKSEGDLRFKVM